MINILYICQILIKQFYGQDTIARSKFLGEDSRRKEEFVQSIGQAFQEIGFCAIKGHLLSDELVERLYRQIKLFFDLQRR